MHGVRSHHMDSEDPKTERQHYQVVKDWLQEYLEQRFPSSYLEITASGKFSERLKAHIGQHRDIVFRFLREAAPDITGFVGGDASRGFVVVEVKARTIKLDDLYQARKYAELFDARYALLVSTEEIPQEIIRLSQVVFPYLPAIPAYGRLTLVRFQKGTDVAWSASWFPEDPFLKKA